MTWLEHHRLSERYASDAEVARLRGKHARAKDLSAIAAQHEARALEEVAPDKPRTYGITAVSAVALHFKAAEFPKAKDLAYRCLASRRLPEFASRQIEDLLQSIHRESAKLQRGNLDYPTSYAEGASQAPGSSARGGEGGGGGDGRLGVAEKPATPEAEG